LRLIASVSASCLPYSFGSSRGQPREDQHQPEVVPSNERVSRIDDVDLPGRCELVQIERALISIPNLSTYPDSVVCVSHENLGAR
jgi:hypothetical protein